MPVRQEKPESTETQHTFYVVLTVKGQTRQEAEAFVYERLGRWFGEDSGDLVFAHEYPDGSLLLYRVEEP